MGNGKRWRRITLGGRNSCSKVNVEEWCIGGYEWPVIFGPTIQRGLFVVCNIIRDFGIVN
jgi:hypothetical protein